MSWRDEPKRWYSVSECGCATTSTHHPWVLNGLSLSGEYVNTCDQHKPKPRNNPMTDITLEQRARVLLAAEVGSPLPLEISIAAAAAAVEAALRLSAGADWVLVPRDPTLAMTGAGQLFGLGPNMACTVYQSMLAAAPRHEPGEGS